MDNLDLIGYSWSSPDGERNDSHGGWLFDGVPAPIAPFIKQLEDGPSVNAQDRLGRSSIYIPDTRDGVRTGRMKKITLGWPARTDIQFAMYLRTKRVFVLPILMTIPVFSASSPEGCRTPRDIDAQYLLVYYGKERNWKSGSAVVYVNDSVVSSGYTIDHANGKITFSTALTRSDIVSVTYTYEANYLISAMDSNFLPAFEDLVCAPEVTLQEVLNV